jgi:hypothetical protein
MCDVGSFLYSWVKAGPIGLGTLYSDPRYLRAQSGEPYFVLPTERDLIIMKLLYDDLLKASDKLETTRETAVEILKRDCGVAD